MPQTVSEIKALLAARGRHPRHRFGQNFLVDHNKLRAILEAAEITPGQLILEVGPGTGALTESLLEAGAKVVAVEIDHDMAGILRERIGPDSDRFLLINEDALESKHTLNPKIADALARLTPSPAPAGEGRGEGASSTPGATPATTPHSELRTPNFKLIANLPYNIASPLLAILAADWPSMSLAVVMVQREVADRLTAPPGGKDFGPLTVIMQAMCTLEIVTILSPGCFWPQPQVDSAVVRIARRPQPLTTNPHALSEFLHQLFSKRRKQIGSILGRATAIPAGIDASKRPEQLTVEQLIQLADSMNAAKPHSPPS
jgi:16S rRNA (adenine1518-N6/adenine1519-N6)-dimethyltransferase